MKKQKYVERRGGSRDGAGRKENDSERYTIRLKRETRVRLDRFAVAKGIKHTGNCTFWDILIAALLDHAPEQKPEYLQYIPAVRLRMVSVATAE